MINKLLDWSILYSFDKTGYERHARFFSPLDDKEMSGKRVLVTGGTSGIGAALARRLASAGAEVLVTGRSEEKFREEGLHEVSGLRFATLDMADFSQLASWKLPELDALVCNAGGMPDTLTIINDRYDLIFASQVVGHFILIKRLIDEKKLAQGAPVHITSSGGMYLSALKLDDLCWKKNAYDKVKSYANAKRAQVVLNKQLAKHYPEFHFSCSHPGWVGTKALEQALPDFTTKIKKRLRSAEQGADVIFWCLHQHDALPSGKFWFDRKARHTQPFFWTRTSESSAQSLWSLCERAYERVKTTKN